MMVVLLDCETTGFINNHVIKLERQPEIIEFYGCRADLDTGEILEEVDRLIKPKNEIDPKITEITGITNEMVAERASFKDYFPIIKILLESAPVVIAHNLSYDMEMIDIECEKLGQRINWPQRQVCTVEQTEWVKGYRLNLSALHELLFEEKFEGAHRAKVDVMATLRCAVELHKRRWI
jgi:DNA polymerase III alpha subunit (gram-positive type)